MKKALAVAVVVAALAASPKAEAHPFMCATPLVAGAMPVTMAFMGGITAFATLPAAIVLLQDQNVWGQLFPSVVGEFPNDKHFPVAPVAFRSAKPYHVSVNGVDTLRSDGF
jgi:hypothetical protein